MRLPFVRTLLTGFIWIVTAIDIWCCQWLADPCFYEYEKNPLARLILVNGGVWTLVALKVVGVWIATEWLRYLPIAYTYFTACLMTGLLLVLTGVIPV